MSVCKFLPERFAFLLVLETILEFDERVLKHHPGYARDDNGAADAEHEVDWQIDPGAATKRAPASCINHAENRRKDEGMEDIHRIACLAHAAQPAHAADGRDRVQRTG